MLLSVGLIAAPAGAHFLLNVNIRAFHVEHLPDGLRIYMRLPMPYLVADRVGDEAADGTRAPAPYTMNYMLDGELMHSLDVDAFLEAPLGLGIMAAEGLRLTVEGREIPPEVEAVRVYPAVEQPPFADLGEAQSAFDNPLYPEDSAASFVGDTVIDVMVRYRTGTAVESYGLAGLLDPGLPGQEDTANLLVDYRGGEPRVFRVTGLLEEPILVSTSVWDSVATFLVEGVIHILEGLDHVLFVLCLTIGAAGFANLLWRVTGFTLGHTVTLIAGFLGYVPTGAWFIPAVETGIALSIIYAGAIAVLRKPVGGTFLVTTAIGLLHGLGFSFVLHDILKLDSPNLWQSLLSFNLGVELGQIAIVTLVWPLLLLLDRWNLQVAALGRSAVALPCILIAAFWVAERSLSLIESVG